MNNVNLKALDISKSKMGISHANPLTKATVLNKTNREAGKLIENYFSQVQALAGKPIFSMQENKMVINVFYFIASSFILQKEGAKGKSKDQALDSSTINSLGEVVSKLYKRPVELRLVRLHYPYLNSFILAQVIAMNTRKYNFKAVMNSLFAAVRESVNATGYTTSLPSQIVGLKVKISGRLTTQRSVPRQTVQTAQIGSFSSSVIENKANSAEAFLPLQLPDSPHLSIPLSIPGKRKTQKGQGGGSGNAFVEYAAFTSKNKKGAFTVKVWISQKAYSAA